MSTRRPFLNRLLKHRTGREWRIAWARYVLRDPRFRQRPASSIHDLKPAILKSRVADLGSAKDVVNALRVGIVCHIYYEDLADDLRERLSVFPVSADLLITTDTAEKQAWCQMLFGPLPQMRTEVRVVPNRGRDIAPKLLGFPDAHARNDLVLHLHNKPNREATETRGWRDFALDHVLGSADEIRQILYLFARNPRLGVIGAPHFEPIWKGLGWSQTFAHALLLARAMGVSIDPYRCPDFPSASMFWTRSAALKPLLDLGLTFRDFEREPLKAPIASLAHAIERMVFLSAEKAGFDVVKIAREGGCREASDAVPMPPDGCLDQILRRSTTIASLT